MHLLCQESGAKLTVVSGFCIVDRPNDPVYLVIDNSVMEKIPPDKQRRRTCKALNDLDGVDVSAGKADMIPDGTFKAGTGHSGKFQFSLSRETVATFLPETDQALPKRAHLRKKSR
jgi:hypothetical protein